MSEQKRSTEAKKPAPSKSSRTLAIGAVALLIVVAIAGIVLADRDKAAPAAASVAVATPTTPAASAAPTAVNPNEVLFAAGSPKLPVTASESIARFADTARTGGSGVRVTASFLTGENKARDRDLAAARTTAVREALKADGITADKMQVELVEMPAGSLTEAGANRIALSLR